jgi:hypothetical protein
MDYVKSILEEARVQHGRYKCDSPSTIWLTAANQLFAAYNALSGFALIDKHYRGWHAHHVVEDQDLERLGIAVKFPPYKEQLTVLLPPTAHIGRINSALRNQAPMRVELRASDLLSAYASAYSLVGDYCGGGEQKIKIELMAIVRATLHRGGLV